jgi:hypothetical protein
MLTEFQITHCTASICVFRVLVGGLGSGRKQLSVAPLRYQCEALRYQCEPLRYKCEQLRYQCELLRYQCETSR